MPWANDVVAKLAAGAPADADTCGLLLICSWPMPETVQAAYTAFAEKLRAALPPSAYVYPASTLHCTISTLRPFTAGPVDEVSRKALVLAWTPLLREAAASADWPTGPFRLRMLTPTLGGAAGIIRYEDTDGAVGKMRAALRAVIARAGGVAAEGSADRSAARPPTSIRLGLGLGEPAPHLPDIIHSTVLRWTAEPEHEPALAAFAEVAEAWEPIDVVVDAPKLVIENVPFMHGASVEWTGARPQQIAEYTKNLILDGAIPLRQLTIKKIVSELEAHLGAQAGRDYDKAWLRGHVDNLLVELESRTLADRYEP